MAQRFRERLGEALSERGVVSLFSRLHPLLPQQELLCGVGRLRPCGRTVAIDLTLPEEVQRARYRPSHRYDIKKARQLGGTVVWDRELAFLTSFVEAYQENMRLVEAGGYYFFDRSYFEQLLRQSGTNLFIVLFGETMAAGGIFLEAGGTLQFHLAGTRNEWRKWAPMKLLLDEVRQWAVSRGLKTVHLGGGVNGEEDTLFHYKLGFSELTFPFLLWEWVVDEAAYTELAIAHRREQERAGRHPSEGAFFPEYRRVWRSENHQAGARP
jgi:hypothetical protein